MQIGFQDDQVKEADLDWGNSRDFYEVLKLMFGYYFTCQGGHHRKGSVFSMVARCMQMSMGEANLGMKINEKSNWIYLICSFCIFRYKFELRICVNFYYWRKPGCEGKRGSSAFIYQGLPLHFWMYTISRCWFQLLKSIYLHRERQKMQINDHISKEYAPTINSTVQLGTTYLRG